MPCRPNAAVYRAISRPCPTLAAACWVARSRGRFARPSGASPAAIAPEETRMISVPAFRLCASASARPVRASSSMPPLTEVRDEEPTLTTIRRAPASRARPGASPVTGATTVLLVIGFAESTLLERLRCAAGADRFGPDPGLPLGLELGPGGGLGIPAFLLLLALLTAGGAVADVGEAHVGA